jgi:glutamate/tyrosine decarboxylase-like PLP-dependent enzyme
MASGSSESNFQACFYAREFLKSDLSTVAILSDRAHTSNMKNLHYLNVKYFGQVAKKKGYRLPEELINKGW